MFSLKLVLGVICLWEPCVKWNYLWKQCDMSSHKYLSTYCVLGHGSRWYKCSANETDQDLDLVGFLVKFLIEQVSFVSFLTLCLSGV